MIGCSKAVAQMAKILLNKLSVQVHHCVEVVVDLLCRCPCTSNFKGEVLHFLVTILTVSLLQYADDISFIASSQTSSHLPQLKLSFWSD